jgi:hypothetical protein
MPAEAAWASLASLSFAQLGTTLGTPRLVVAYVPAQSRSAAKRTLDYDDLESADELLEEIAGLKSAHRDVSQELERS